MKLCSITLTSESRDKVIGDAIRSVVDLVDEVIVLHMVWLPAVTGDRTLEIAKEVAGEKLVLVRMDIQESISAMRNFGLWLAGQRGNDWAIQLDTDERFHLNGFSLPTFLNGLPATVSTLLVKETLEGRKKERIFRLPSSGFWKGKVHEEWVPSGDMLMVPILRTSEERRPASKEENQTNMIGLLIQGQQEPHNPAWQYKIGETLVALERFQEAIEFFSRCMFNQADETLAANCLIHMASCQIILENPGQALEDAFEGLRLHVEFPEFFCLIGICYLTKKEFQKAISWFNLAIQLGWETHPALLAQRVGPKKIDAYFNLPLNLMAEAFKGLGQMDMVKQIRIEELKSIKAKDNYLWKGGI